MSVSLKTTDRQLQSACESSDMQACKDALLDWGKALFIEQPPTSLGELGDRAGEPLKSEIDALNSALYSQHKESWNGAALWRASRELLSKQKQIKSSHTEQLEPLYK